MTGTRNNKYLQFTMMLQMQSLRNKKETTLQDYCTGWTQSPYCRKRKKNKMNPVLNQSLTVSRYLSHLGLWFSRGTARQLNGSGTLPLRWILTHQETNYSPSTSRKYRHEWTPVTLPRGYGKFPKLLPSRFRIYIYTACIPCKHYSRELMFAMLYKLL